MSAMEAVFQRQQRHFFVCLEAMISNVLRQFYKVHESPAAHGDGTVDVDMAAAGVVSDEQTVLKQGKHAAKRSTKKDDDAWGC
jgi:hypothetical protein